MSDCDIRGMAREARAAARELARASGEQKDRALLAMASGLMESRTRILADNAAGRGRRPAPRARRPPLWIGSR